MNQQPGSQSAQSISAATARRRFKALMVSSIVDQMFPLYDQMMQKVYVPEFFSSLVTIFITIQILFITLWIYSPVYSRTTGNYKKIYRVILYMVSFHDPTDVSTKHNSVTIALFAISIIGSLWIIFAIFWIKKYFILPNTFVLISVLIIEIAMPILMVPSAYLTCYGIYGCYINPHLGFATEIIIGMLSFIISSCFFYIGVLMKSKSIIFTNLSFQLFDSYAVVTWFSFSTFQLILSAIMVFFNDWFYVFVALFHLITSSYCGFRICFFPFYTLWRNPSCLTVAITTIMMDINFIVLYFVKGSTYNYVIVFFLLAAVLAYIVSQISMKMMIKKIQSNLTRDDEYEDLTDKFDSFEFYDNYYKAQAYISVGIARHCDLFLNGSMVDYFIEFAREQKILSLLLQVVAFFPSESRRMNILFKKLISSRKLDVGDRFLVYQIKKIKSKRMSSSTTEQLEELNKLKLLHIKCRNIVNSFWEKQDAGLITFSSITSEIRHTHKAFDYHIMNSPNNIAILDEFTNFLVDCCCDFDTAIRQSIKIDRIVDGKSFIVDTSFRSLISKFPEYLTQKIVDVKGNCIKVDTTNTSKNGSSGHNSVKFSQDSTSNIDAETEELFGSKLIKESKLRLALYHSLQDHKPSQSCYVIIFAIFTFVVHVFMFKIFYNTTKGTLNSYTPAYEYLLQAGNSMFYLNYANFHTILSWAETNDKLDRSFSSITNYTTDYAIYVDHKQSLHKIVNYTLDQSKSYAEQLLNVIEQNGEAYDLVANYITLNSSLTICKNKTQLQSFTTSYINKLMYLIYAHYSIIGDFSENTNHNIFESDFYCDIYSNIESMVERSYNTLQFIHDYSTRNHKLNTKLFNIGLIIGTIIVCITGFIPIISIMCIFRFNLRKMIRVLQALPNPAKDYAKDTLFQKNPDSKIDTVVNKNAKSIAWRLIFAIHALLILVITILYFLFAYRAKITESNLTMFNEWYHISISRMISVSKIATDILLLVLNNNSSFIDKKYLTYYINRTKEILEEANTDLLRGKPGMTKSIGFDDDLDSLELENICETGDNISSMHEMCKCMNLNTLMNFFIDVIKDILTDYDSFNSTLKSETMENLIHMTESHIYPSVSKVTNKIADLIQDNYKNDVDFQRIILYQLIYLLVLQLIITLCYIIFINSNYKLILTYIQKLPLDVIAYNKDMLAFFFSARQTTSESMPISKSIVFGANESIIITSQNGIIEIINPSVNTNLGMTPDQLLGQFITNFMMKEDQKKVRDQIDLISSGQSKVVWDDHITMVSGNGHSVPFAVSMIELKDNENNSSIVFILRNETEELKKRTDAENAKAKSEKLLQQILPKDIIVRLNRGEKDISFTIPRASIFFVDIVKFSKYASELSPQEIMQNLSTVFASFDKSVSNFPSITKIKLIGDVYMAASGLFQSPDDESPKHAEDAVNCCFKILSALETVNTNLESSLEVRIGINSGGPLIGGVLGTDKPTFDIIGDPINVASRLQSTDVPGKIHISQATKELISNLDFIIEERGSVFLKGKGNQTTYFVSKNTSTQNESFALNMISGRLP